MHVAIIGTGNVGGSLARLWLERGRAVVLGVRSTEKIAETQQAFAGSHVALISDAVAQSEVVVLAVPWQAAESVVQAADLSGKVVIDATNPLKPDLSGLAVSGDTSAAERIQQLQPQARVVKAFNTIGALYLGNAHIEGLLADGFYCGDDVEAKKITAELIADAGLHPQDVGSLRNARYLEAMAMLWIDMAVLQRRSGRFGFRLLNDPA